MSSAGLALSQDIQRIEPEKYSIPVSNCIALNVYSNTNPHNLKIASLQKGLVLACDGKEVVGEGGGFGFPVIICPEETYFSGSAAITLSRTSESFTVRKVFSMNRASRNKLGNVRLENHQARAFIRYLSELYQGNKRFRSILLLKEFIVTMGVEATFDDADSIGKLQVTYEICGNVIKVKVDLSQIEKERRKRVFVLNEQSAGFLRRYSDSRGTLLVDGQIGAWDDVEAESACLSDLQGQFGFRLWQAEGAVLRRGRETMCNCLDWAGLDYEVNPNNDFFEYRIELLGAKQTW
jgi:hypothetical protein